MKRPPITRQSLRCLLTGGLVAVVVGLSFVQFTAVSRTVVTLATGSELKGELSEVLEFDAFELVADLPRTIEPTSHGFTDRLADESVEARAFYQSAHLERGPPRC